MNFSTIEELIENIERGGEIEFIYNEKSYSITHSEKGIHVMQMYNYLTEEIYMYASDIVNYEIEKKTIKTIFEKINIVFRCF